MASDPLTDLREAARNAETEGDRLCLTPLTDARLHELATLMEPFFAHDDIETRSYEIMAMVNEILAYRAQPSTGEGWSENPPKEAGWYWRRYGKGMIELAEGRHPQIVYVALKNGGLYDTSWSPAIHTVEEHASKEFYEWWSKPIPAPSPKGEVGG